MAEFQIEQNPSLISILIIDKEEKLFNNIRKYFKKKVKVKNLTKLSNVEQELETYFPDVLLIDITMLNKRQDEIIKTLNSINKAKYIPKIFLTIKSLTEDRINGYNLGCDSYLSKPLDPEELEAIIINLVRQSRIKIKWLLDAYLKMKKIKINFLEKASLNYITKVQITNQEKKILKKIVENKTNSEIAYELNITKRIVEKHVTRLLNKTNMNHKTELKNLY
jgi:DNA-binding NarL/FixJ family response regulator